MKTSALLRNLLVTLFAFFASGALAEDKASTVTLPVDVYREYLELKKRPAVTLVDDVVVTGKIAEGHLTLKAKGQMSGNSPAVEFLDLPENTRLRQCDGTALIYKGDKGYLLLAKADKFTVSCELSFRQLESLGLNFAKGVLDVHANISDASVVEQPSGTGEIRLTITRKMPQQVRSTAEGKVTMTPRYRLTVTSDQIRFRYDFAFENPNTQTKRFPIKLVNGEIVGQIQTNLANESSDKEIVLQLRPGTSQATLSGQLPKNQFQPLFDSEEQYLLMEFHPLVALKLTKEPPRIGIEQTGMAPQYQAAMAFLIGKGKRLEWESKVREVFASESFAAQSANYLVYLPRRGDSIVDASWQLQNQGKPSLQFNLPGKAFFASSNGTPQVLAKTEKNELFLPLRTGQTALRIQYDPSEALPKLLGVWKTDLVKPSSALPQAGVNVRMASRHQILAASLLGRAIFPWFDARAAVWAMIVGFLWAFGLKSLGIRSKRLVFLSAAAFFFSALAWDDVLPWTVTALCAAALVRHREQILDWFRAKTGALRRSFAIGLTLLGVLGLVIFLTTLMSPMARRSRTNSEQLAGNMVQSYDKVADMGRGGQGFTRSAKMKNAPSAPATEEAIADLDAAAPAEKQDETYLGLPVERVIPSDGESLWLAESSIPEKSPLRLRLLLVSDPVSWLFLFAAFVTWLAPVTIHRKNLMKEIFGR